MLKEQDSIGFIFSVDIVLDESTNIRNLNTENATIHILDNSDSVVMLDKNQQTTIISLENNTRIYVDNYNKDSEYTRVIYKDSSLKTYEGYIETKYIQMDKLDNSEMILYN